MLEVRCRIDYLTTIREMWEERSAISMMSFNCPASVSEPFLSDDSRHVVRRPVPLCDVVRGRRVVDVQVVNPAMRQYVRNSARDVQKLLGYARALGVEKKIRNYLEVLL